MLSIVRVHKVEQAGCMPHMRGGKKKGAEEKCEIKYLDGR